MHPFSTPTRLPRWGPRRWLRCSSLKYSRYCHPTAQTTRGGGPGSRSSRLATGAGRLAGLGATPDFHHGLLTHSTPGARSDYTLKAVALRGPRVLRDPSSSRDRQRFNDLVAFHQTNNVDEIRHDAGVVGQHTDAIAGLETCTAGHADGRMLF